MTKRVLLLQAGAAFVEEDRNAAEQFVARRGAKVLDISRCSLQEVVDMACDYGWNFGRVQRFFSVYDTKYKDYLIDTKDEDWWDNQVGK